MWTTREPGCQSNGEINYDDSARIESKQSHQWLMDISGSELFSNKKQAIDGGKNSSGSGTPNTNASLWHNSSRYHSASGRFTDRLLGPGLMQTTNLNARSILQVDDQTADVARKNFRERYDNPSSIGLPMSQTGEDTSSCLNFGGIRKVKVNQVQDFNKGMLEPIGQSYGGGNPRSLEMSIAYDRGENNTIPLGQAYSNSNKNFISMGPDFSKAGGNFIPMGQNFFREGDSFVSASDFYDKRSDNILSMGQPFDKGVGNGSLAPVGQSFGMGNLICMDPSYNKGHENFISMAPSFDKPTENLISIGSSFHKGDDNILSMDPSSNKACSNMTFMVPNQDKGDAKHASTGYNFHKDESNTISFGPFHSETGMIPSSTIINSYDSMGNGAEASEQPRQKDLLQENMDVRVNKSLNGNSKVDTTPKSKELKSTKKVSPTTFPSNVKSLLSTGLFDGVHVKYYSWSREKSLKGIIKGTGYLCGCKDCNLTRVINAYEFERHANCKTKHPNNHIYFENGKTIYAVVQELKNTPQEMLFDVIQTVTGSQINQKNFDTWKASYLAASRELQRIYGKDSVIMPY